MNTQYSWLCMCQLNNYKSHTLYTVITVNCPLKQVSSRLSKWPEVTLTGWNWKQQTAIMWETRDLKVIWTVAAAICSGSRFRSASVWLCVCGSLGQLTICSVSIVALCGGRALTSYKRTNTSESHTHSSSCHSALGENKSYSEVLQLPQQQDYQKLRGSQVGIKAGDRLYSIFNGDCWSSLNCAWTNLCSKAPVKASNTTWLSDEIATVDDAFWNPPALVDESSLRSVSIGLWQHMPIYAWHLTTANRC